MKNVHIRKKQERYFFITFSYPGGDSCQSLRNHKYPNHNEMCKTASEFVGGQKVMIKNIITMNRQEYLLFNKTNHV